MKKKWLLKRIFWSYLIFIILLVVLPLNSASALNDITVISFRGDYFFHAVLFLPWAFFGILFSLHRIYWFIAGLLFASASEMVQYALFYRAFNINDMIANMIGIMTGFLLLWIWLTLKKDFPVD